MQPGQLLPLDTALGLCPHASVSPLPPPPQRMSGAAVALHQPPVRRMVPGVWCPPLCDLRWAGFHLPWSLRISAGARGQRPVHRLCPEPALWGQRPHLHQGADRAATEHCCAHAQRWPPRGRVALPGRRGTLAGITLLQGAKTWGPPLLTISAAGRVPLLSPLGWES